MTQTFDTNGGGPFQIARSCRIAYGRCPFEATGQNELVAIQDLASMLKGTQLGLPLMLVILLAAIGAFIAHAAVSLRTRNLCLTGVSGNINQDEEG